MEKILLDTDIGTDIDDAITMSYLLKQKRCELLGITVTGGETEKRAALASVMCRAAGRPDLPIYPGPDRPLLVRQKECFAPQAKILRDWEHQESFPRGEAIAFMRRTIRANPGEVTLLAIAPLTNIALLFASDPEIPSLLKRLVLMGGRFSNFASVLTDNIDKAFVPEHTDPHYLQWCSGNECAHRSPRDGNRLSNPSADSPFGRCGYDPLGHHADGRVPGTLCRPASQAYTGYVETLDCRTHRSDLSRSVGGAQYI